MQLRRRRATRRASGDGAGGNSTSGDGASSDGASGDGAGGDITSSDGAGGNSAYDSGDSTRGTGSDSSGGSDGAAAAAAIGSLGWVRGLFSALRDADGERLRYRALRRRLVVMAGAQEDGRASRWGASLEGVYASPGGIQP